MTQRVVDALEFVDIDVKQCDLFATLNLAELLLEPILEERAIGQAGQCIVMRQIGDPIFRLLAIGYVLVSGDPSRCLPLADR